MGPALANDSRATPIATLWELQWNDDRLACVIYRRGRELRLELESREATILSEPFELQPRMVARSRALHRSLRRRGWLELPE